MPNYPSKRHKVLSGRFGFDMEKIEAGMENGKLDTASALATGAGAAITALGKKDLGYGVSYTGTGAATAGGALKGAGTGYQIGKILGPKGAVAGAAIGTVVGGVSSLAKAGQMKKDAQSAFTLNLSEAINTQSKKSRRDYAGLGGFKAQSYEKGGKINTSGKAVIMGGKLHKDGGNPIVKAETGEKIAETEREELLLTSEQTESLESLIKAYDSKKLETQLVKLGKRIQEILLNETIDNSGLYGLSA